MPDIDFRGYSGDCLIHGRIEVPEDIRLTDYLNTTETYIVHGASLFALDDGREVPAGDQELASEDLWAVEPTDTAVRADLHVPTRAVAIEIDLPPYQITGFLHGVNTGDPVAGVSRRRRMIPITEATIRFTFNGSEMSRDTGVLIVNRDRAASLKRTALEKSKIDDIPLPPVDPRAQDLTGKIIYDREE
ncbi:MAG TPA: hypothetical protein VH371_03575 [Candidatus Limnocylindrales bacterium]|jgi:hypothetical protein